MHDIERLILWFLFFSYVYGLIMLISQSLEV